MILGQHMKAETINPDSRDWAVAVRALGGGLFVWSLGAEIPPSSLSRTDSKHPDE